MNYWRHIRFAWGGVGMRVFSSIVLRWWSFILVSIVFSVLISSIFYLVLNFLFYYKGAEWNIKSEAKIVRNALDAYLSTNSDKNNTTVRGYISRLISRDKSYIVVKCVNGQNVVWVEANGNLRYLDGTRDIVQFVDSIISNELVYHIEVKRGNRPRWYRQLYRAWTFSFEDYIKDKEKYITKGYKYRSWPLYLGFILSGISVLSVMMFIRKICMDNLRQLNEFQDQLASLNESQSKMIIERDAMSASLSNLHKAGKQLYAENIELKRKLDKLSYYETVTSELENENDQLKIYFEKARLLYKEYKSVKNKYDVVKDKLNEGNEYLDIMNEEIAKLQEQLNYKDNEINSKSMEIMAKEKEINELQKRISLNKYQINDISIHKNVDKALKTVLPRVLFSKHAVKQIVADAPLSDNNTLEIMSQLLVAIENGYQYEELCKRYNCKNMKENYGLYRLKKGDCRIYFYFIPVEVKKQCGYKNSIAEVVYVLYKKKQNSIPDYVKKCRPSWCEK